MARLLFCFGQLHARVGVINFGLENNEGLGHSDEGFEGNGGHFWLVGAGAGAESKSERLGQWIWIGMWDVGNGWLGLDVNNGMGSWVGFLYFQCDAANEIFTCTRQL